MMEQGTFRHVTDNSRNQKLALSLVKLKPALIGFQTLMPAYNLLTISRKKDGGLLSFSIWHLEGEQERHL